MAEEDKNSSPLDEGTEIIAHAGHELVVVDEYETKLKIPITIIQMENCILLIL